jgi:hypothetical protein
MQRIEAPTAMRKPEPQTTDTRRSLQKKARPKSKDDKKSVS